MNGTMPLPMARNRYFTVFGGPYMECPAEMFGVRLEMKANKPSDLDIHIKDFSVPTHDQIDKALPVIVDSILAGRPVYVGCKGGIGRTGMLLALLAKAWGISDPVAYVREHYLSYAVETTGQHEFIRTYEVPRKVQVQIKWAKFLSIFGVRDSMTDFDPLVLQPKKQGLTGWP